MKFKVLCFTTFLAAYGLLGLGAFTLLSIAPMVAFPVVIASGILAIVWFCLASPACRQNEQRALLFSHAYVTAGLTVWAAHLLRIGSAADPDFISGAAFIMVFVLAMLFAMTTRYSQFKNLN